MDNIGKQLGIENMDQWYNVKAEDVIQHQGAWILDFYGDSLIKHSLLYIQIISGKCGKWIMFSKDFGMMKRM